MIVNCKLLQPIVAKRKDGQDTVTIPAGAVVEVRVRKGNITEVFWEGECFFAQLDDVVSACPLDGMSRFGWY